MQQKTEIQNRNSAMCYIPFFGWIPGVVFLVIEKDRGVRWNAAQSILAHAILAGVYWVAIPLLKASVILLPIAWVVSGLVGAGFFIISLVAVARVHQGGEIKWPIISEWTDKIAKSYKL